MTTPLTAEQLEELRRLSGKAFKAPWTYTRFEVECGGDELGDVNGDDAHDCIEVEAPDEYPNGQCVCQQTIAVPGLEMFAEPNGKLIAEMRNALPALLDAAEENARLRDALSAVVELCETFEKDAVRGLSQPLPSYVEGGYRDRLLHVRAIKEMTQALRPQPEPRDERRDKQGEPEQLVGSGDGPKHRDGR